MNKPVKAAGVLALIIISVVVMVKVHSTYQIKKSFTLMKGIRYFTIDGSIPVDKRNDALQAYKAIFNNKNAREYFNTLLEEASIEGRLYALCGLYYKSNDQYRVALDKFRNKKILFHNWTAGQKQVDTVANIIEFKSQDAVRLKNQSQTLQEWSREHNRNDFHLDFMGGGIPAALKANIDNRK